MKFKEIPDMERYLKHDCYCPGEIYDVSGFFYQVYESEDDCEIIYQNQDATIIIADIDSNKPQAIYIWHNDCEQPGKIIDTQRVDATENNVGILVAIAKGEKPGGRKLDEFEPGSTKSALSKLMSIADCVMID